MYFRLPGSQLVVIVFLFLVLFQCVLNQSQKYRSTQRIPTWRCWIYMYYRENKGLKGWSKLKLLYSMRLQKTACDVLTLTAGCLVRVLAIAGLWLAGLRNVSPLAQTAVAPVRLVCGPTGAFKHCCLSTAPVVWGWHLLPPFCEVQTELRIPTPSEPSSTHLVASPLSDLKTNPNSQKVNCYTNLAHKKTQ